MLNLRRLTALAVVLIAGAAQTFGASINYGSFGPSNGLTFVNVVESSATDSVPLYGPPTLTGNTIDFDPTTFLSTASGGAADATDGQLNFTITAATNVGIDALSLLEAGDYSLAGVGTPATSAFAGAIMRVTVTQINGANVVGGPIELAPVNASVGFALPGVAVTQPWSLGLFLDIGAQLAGLGYGPNDLATSVEVVIDNTLLTTSEASTVALIAKKNVRIDVLVPEPASLGLLGLGVLVVMTRRRAA